MNISDLKIHHIGVVVADIASAKEVYTENGYLCGETLFDSNQNVNLCIAEKPDELAVWLIERTENSNLPMAASDTEGENAEVYCVGYSVENIDAIAEDLVVQGWELIKAPFASFLPQSRSAFLYSKEAGLIELLEQKA